MPARFGLTASIVLFGVPALMLYGATHGLIPVLVGYGLGPLPAWFAAGGLCVFLPLLVAALVVARSSEPRASWRERFRAMRVNAMRRRDWAIAGAALLAAFALSGAMQQLGAALWPHLPPHPPFILVEKLAPSQYYLLLLWLPLFAVNVVGEELWWRGIIQTRQEAVFGPATWLVQGVLHSAFHVSFGLGVLLVAWPVAFAIPWAVQKTRNTTTGMVIHAAFNGSGFLLVTLGLLPV